jgi:hypothetical protein
MEVMASAIELLTKRAEFHGFVLGAMAEALAAHKWLDDSIKDYEEVADELRAQIANATFTAIVAQAPFAEFADKDLADSYKVDVTTKSGAKLTATIVFTTKVVEL